MLGQEELVVVLGLLAILEENSGDLERLIVPEAVSLHVHGVEVCLEEAFALEPHSVGLGGLVLPIFALKCIHVEA